MGAQGDIAERKSHNGLKTAVITGSTKGIGLAVARDLLQRGYRVLLNYSSDEKTANDVQTELSRCYPDNQYKIIKADLSDLNSCEYIRKEAYLFLNKIDILILNAGSTCRESYESTTLDDWHNVIDTNLTVPFFLIQKLLPMISKGGKILCIGSIMGIYPHATSLPYGISKAGLHYMVRSMVKVLTPYGITINAVCPGFIDTAWQNGKSSDIRDSIEDKIALGRFGTPEEVSSLCVNVLSNDYLNGSVLVIDGGYCYE